MSNLNLHELINEAEVIIKEITKHPEFLALDYQPDLTIGDAMSALSYLKYELESQQLSNKFNGV